MKQKAFTLMELVLYVSLTSLLLISVSVLMSALFQSRIKNQVIAEVEQQGIQIMQTINQTVRNSENVTSPSIGNSGTTLILDVVDPLDDPTSFSLSAGVMQVTEAGGPAVDLNNARVIVSAVNFQNLARPGTNDSIRVSFTVTHANPGGNNAFDYQKTFYGAASLRQ